MKILLFTTGDELYSAATSGDFDLAVIHRRLASEYTYEIADLLLKKGIPLVSQFNTTLALP